MISRNKFLLGILAAAIIAVVFRYRFGGDALSLDAAKCKKIGGKWGQCFLSAPCCSLGRLPDAGKECTKSSDCSSGACLLIERDTLNPINDYSVGNCRSYFTGDPDDISRPTCGEAKIDNGKIVEDLRNIPVGSDDRCRIH